MQKQISLCLLFQSDFKFCVNLFICIVNLTYFFSYFGGEEFQHLVASWWLSELVQLSNSSNVYKYSMMYLCCQMTLKHQKISKLWKTKGTVSNPRQHFPEWVTVWVTLTSFFLVILFQALHCKNIQKARELWDSIMTKGNAKFANMWLEYYNLERYVSACLMPSWWTFIQNVSSWMSFCIRRSYGDPVHCRKALHRAVQCTSDYPEHVCEVLLTFERVEGESQSKT